MKLRAIFFVVVMLSCLGLFPATNVAHAESTMSCPNGTYDMLDWMTMDSNMRSASYLKGSSNPIYTTLYSDKFYWTKGANGSPWDIQLYDSNYIYLWITEYSWNDPSSYKKSTNNTNMPLTARCSKGGFPGSAIKVSNTNYDIYTDCSHHTTHTLKKAVNEVWGPYSLSFGGSLPNNMSTLVASYRYNCDNNYANCADKEEYYLSQKYGLVQWVHYTLVGGVYQQQQKSVFNQLATGVSVPKFQCF